MDETYVVHASQNGKILCGLVPKQTEPFYAIPLYRGTEPVTCGGCLLKLASTITPRHAATSTCPICGNESLAGPETGHVCDKCWTLTSAAFSLSTDGPESHADFGATMAAACVAAGTARVRMRKLLRRERVTRLWQSLQCWLLLCCLFHESKVDAVVKFRKIYALMWPSGGSQVEPSS